MRMRAWRQTSRIFPPFVRCNHLGRKDATGYQHSAGRTDAFGQLQRQGGRILAIVQRKVQERRDLLAELEQGSPSPDNIRRSKQIKELEPIQAAWDEWQRIRQSLQETIPLFDDDDPNMRVLADEEYSSLIEELSHQIDVVFPSLLVPKSPTINLSALLELKSGVGGSEASLFLSDILRMYIRFAQLNRWSTKLLAKNELENGGLKDAILEVGGDGAYDAFRWESGVHRVQRVPATEASGRVHTSTVAVVVLPFSTDATPAPETNKLYEEQDIKIEVMRARGAGGQHVNKTESAVRLTHIPTGISVSMQDERSQHMNKARAFQVLRARLLDRKLAAEAIERRTTRRDLVKSADRSEKVRTYNFAQDRVTDHRLGLTQMNLESVLEGDGLQVFVDALKKAHGETIIEAIINDVPN